MTPSEQIAALLRVDGKLDSAVNMVGRLCEGSQEWVMHIPARPDKDPDIVISDALHGSRTAIRQMVKDIGALRKTIIALEGVITVTNAALAMPSGELEQKIKEILTATAHYEGIEL